ncbi:MAG: hypothetical protein WCH43_06730 [Verrucomicrobiota bacterium]
MKSILFILLTAMAGSSLYAQDFAIRQQRIPQPEKKTPKVAEQGKTEGSLQHAAHFSNPLQAINPLAPADCGSGKEYVYYDEQDPNHTPRGHKENPKGIKLFAFAFW